MTGNLRLWTIYDHPTDAPEHFVVRGFTILPGQDPLPDEDGYLADTLDGARAVVEQLGGDVNLGRVPTDDQPIVETWI